MSDLIGARRGERTEDRVTHRNGIGRGGGHAGVPGPLRPSLGGRLCPTVIAQLPHGVVALPRGRPTKRPTFSSGRFDDEDVRLAMAAFVGKRQDRVRPRLRSAVADRRTGPSPRSGATRAAARGRSAAAAARRSRHQAAPGEIGGGADLRERCPRSATRSAMRQGRRGCTTEDRVRHVDMHDETHLAHTDVDQCLCFKAPADSSQVGNARPPEGVVVVTGIRVPRPRSTGLRAGGSCAVRDVECAASASCRTELCA